MTFLSEFAILAPYLGATLVSSLVAAVLFRGHREVKGRAYFGSMMVAVAAWSFLNFLEDGSTTFGEKLAYANLQYLFIGAVPVLFFRFATLATLGGSARWLQTWWFRAAIWVIPLTTAGASWFDPVWGWVRREVVMMPADGFTVLVKTWGPGFWVFTGFSYVLMSISVVLWARFLWRQRRTDLRIAVLPLGAVFLPWISNLLVLIDLNPWPGHDPTTPALGLMGLVLLLTLRNTRTLSALPAAWDTLMEVWPAPLAVFDSQGALVYLNGRAQRTWNLTSDVLGTPREQVLSWLPPSPDDRVLGRSLVKDPSNGTVWEVEERPMLSRGQFRGTLVAFHDVSSFEDRVTERTLALESAYTRLSTELQHRRTTEQQLFYYSLHDSLTGLANRSLFLSRLGQALDRIRRHPSGRFGVFELNFSGFKQINDRYGHVGGDQFLIQTARRLRSLTRTVDTAARSGADTFLVLREGVGTLEALREEAEHLRTALEGPFNLDGTNLIPRVRIGMILGNPDYTGPEALLDDVEIAMARTTLDKGQPLVLFEPEWKRAQRDRHDLKEDLAKALVQGNLHLVYQPIIDLVTGELKGVEALTRWVHPLRGTIPPDQFIVLAEQEGTIKPLGLWVLRESARAFVELGGADPRFRDAYVSVNVSPRQMSEPDFASIVLALLDREGLDPCRLHLEITETALVENGESLLPVLADLRREGISIKLDDFGTGYSSLHALHRLPVDTLKIDRSFVAELPQGRPIIRTILGLAAELGLEVVAEGIETDRQRQWLIDLDCRLGQGFLFSRGWMRDELIGKFRMSAQGPSIFLDDPSRPA